MRIAKKRANNECALFNPLLVVDLRGGSDAKRPIDEAREAFDSLFKF